MSAEDPQLGEGIRNFDEVIATITDIWNRKSPTCIRFNPVALPEYDTRRSQCVGQIDSEGEMVLRRGEGLRMSDAA